jgi:16S rRNA (guanine527-N7)-methyltransferase
VAKIDVAGKQVSVPDAREIHRILSPFGGAALPEAKIDLIQRYLAILLFWNQRVSLTSMESAEEILARQFGESLLAVSALSVEKGRLADVGSGAGFPGIALKIFAPGLEVHLIEQNAKKATFLRETARFLSLEDIFVSGKDYQQFPAESGSLDWITAKALGGYEELLNWAHSRLSSTGKVALWLGSNDASRISAVCGWRWARPITIPDSQRRALISGTAI